MTLIGPITKDGDQRLKTSEEMKTFSSDTAEELKRLTKGLGEKNTPIGLRIMDSNSRLADIKVKLEKQATAGQKKEEELAELKSADPSAQPALTL